MDEQNPAQLIELVRLLQEGTELEWADVEALVDGFPGWPDVVSYLRTQQGKHAATSGYMSGPMGMNLVPMEISEATRRAMLEIFTPYAILLDSQRSAGERAEQLNTLLAGKTTHFCRECLHSESSLIIAAAQDVLAAREAQSGLLRGTSAPDHTSELLHLPEEGVVQEALLTPADPQAASPASQEPSRPRSWLARLLHRDNG